MRKFKAFVSYILVIALLISLLPFGLTQVKAATSSNTSIQSYGYNSTSGKYELTITWQGSKSTASATVDYHDDATGAVKTLSGSDVVVSQLESINLSYSKFMAVINVSDLKEDYLYDLKITTYNGSGSKMMEGYLYFITGMTFTSERVDQAQTPGVYESGDKPELKLSWKVPKVWNGNTSTWLPITDSSTITYMNSILTLDNPLSRAEFKINISTKSQKLDSGADISPIFIKLSPTGTYQASDASSDASGTPKDVSIDADGNMSINIIGRKDTTETPVFTAADPRLYHSQILPGTVYFMNIKSVYYDTTNTVADVFTLGDPTQYNGSLVRDKASGLGYTYTPVRFNLSRDASDNIYVTVYRINKDDGSLDMPNLYYSIQAIDTPINTYGADWPEKARMTDQFFPANSSYAVTVITGIDPNTPMYYRVVVKTDSKADRLESLKLLYKMSVDTSKPPIPINVAVDATQSKLVKGTANDPATGAPIVDASGNPVAVRSTDILLTWDKPTNFENMTAAEKADLVFHVEISTNADDLKINYPLKFAGLEREYLINYRWVKAISASDPNLIVAGNKLTYKLEGFSLFKSTIYDDPSTTTGTDIALQNPDKYPDWLIENTIYYVKMFTTKTLGAAALNSMTDSTGDGVIDIKDFEKNAGTNAESVVSQPSVVASFTTLPGVDKQVPVPTGFTAYGEGIDSSTLKNYINLQFDRATINWSTYTSTLSNNKEYYELFMASGSDDNPQYFQIGSTDSSFNLTTDQINNGFTKAQFNLQNGVWLVTIPDLRQNTVYRFKLRIRLNFSNNSQSDMYSDFTSVVSVTTSKKEIVEPDKTTKIPMAPTDFNIGTTSDGKPDLSGTGVGLDWSILENDVTYELVATSTRIGENDDESVFNNDSYYNNFINKFGSGTNDNVKVLNPKTAGGRYSADLTALRCKYSVSDFMVPNSIYYYSIRAQRTVVVTDASGNQTLKVLSSKWVTIPVTTSLIEAPTNLVNVQDNELGVSWTDSTAGINAKSYTIYIKKASETNYKALDITRATIIKNNDGQTYYARITGLESGTEYNIGALKGTNTSNLTFQQTFTLTTRDEYHNVEVKWTGISGYNYEIAMRNDTTGQYTVLSSSDFEIVNKEKANDLVGTQYYNFYARIKTIPVTLSDNSVVSVQLTSNTKYYIKVRASQTGVQSSNYAGPVTARTSFLQSDYDNNENLDNSIAKLVDKIDQLEQKPYYSLNYILSTTNTLLLKGDRLAEELSASPYHNLTIDLTSVSSAGRVDEIYIPKVLAQTIKSSGGSIKFTLDKANYKLVSSVLDESSYTEAASLKNSYNEEELWFKLTISRPDGGTEGLQASVEPVSQVNIVRMNVLAMSGSYSELKKDFTDKIYNSETGLLEEKKGELKDLYTKNPGSLSSQTDYMINALVSDVEAELADYVKATIEGGYDSSSKSTKVAKILDSKDLTEFSAPIITDVNIKRSDNFCQPYGLYTDNGEWRKLDVLNRTNDNISFEFIKAGKYFVGVSSSFTDSVPKEHWAYQNIVAFNNLYNIADVFSASGDFLPDAPVTLKESIQILDKVFSKDSVNGETTQKKVARLGLSKYFASVSPVKDLSREQAATLYSSANSLKNGIALNTIRPSGVAVFNDAGSISTLHFGNVEYAVGQGYMTCDSNGMFNPSGYVTRAEFITSLQKALQ